MHSLKDLPTHARARDSTLAAMLPREDPRDALLSRAGASLRKLPRGARIGTSSLRRRAFLRARARMRARRSNCAATCRRASSGCGAGDYDAIVLAAAGLSGSGLQGTSPSTWPPEEFRRRSRRESIGVVCARTMTPTLRWLRSAG